MHYDKLNRFVYELPATLAWIHMQVIRFRKMLLKPIWTVHCTHGSKSNIISASGLMSWSAVSGSGQWHLFFHASRCCFFKDSTSPPILPSLHSCSTTSPQRLQDDLTLKILLEVCSCAEKFESGLTLSNFSATVVWTWRRGCSWAQIRLMALIYKNITDGAFTTQHSVLEQQGRTLGWVSPENFKSQQVQAQLLCFSQCSKEWRTS